MTQSTSITEQALLKRELESFIKANKLSDREGDIIYQLISGTYASNAIAVNLGVSPNTVNNHLQSIFDKTKTRSRSDLLSTFLKFSFSRLGSAHLFARVPRVLVVDDEPTAVEMLKGNLDLCGFNVLGESDPAEAIKQISTFNPDVVISDVMMPGISGYDLLAQLRSYYVKHPQVVIISANPGKNESEIMDLGAAALFSKPVDFDRLSFCIMELCVDNDYERSRLLRVKTNRSVVCDQKMTLKLEDIGFGGAFIAIDFMDAEIRRVFTPGSIVSMSFQLEDDQVEHHAKVEVMWDRLAPNRFGPAGVGVKFVELSPDTRTAVEEYVRCRKIRSFIPIGRHQQQ